MPVQRFVRSALPAVPWKNGGGLTREIVCRPPASDMESFDWRVSIAELTASGAFSIFNSVDRVIVLLHGQGVQLQSSDGCVDHALCEPLVPFAFSGDDAITASLLGGASSDFNVMARRDTTRADVRIVRRQETLGESSGGTLLAARGIWSARSAGAADDAAQPLDPGEGLWWSDEPRAWHLESRDADAALIAVRIWPR